jgi:hypothetical protein
VIRDKAIGIGRQTSTPKITRNKVEARVYQKNLGELKAAGRRYLVGSDGDSQPSRNIWQSAPTRTNIDLQTQWNWMRTATPNLDLISHPRMWEKSPRFFENSSGKSKPEMEKRTQKRPPVVPATTNTLLGELQNGMLYRGQ